MRRGPLLDPGLRRLNALLLLALLADRPLWLDRPDLHAHFWLSYGLALTTTEILEGPDPSWGPQLGTPLALGVASGATAALGLAKEYLVDTEADGADLLADALGIAANALLQVLVDF